MNLRNVILSFFVVTTILFTAAGCNNEPKENADQDYIKLIKEWDQERAESLKSKTGWLNLAGLYWLKEGENKFGSAQDNDVVFPSGKSDDYVGSFFLLNGEVTVKINDGSEVYNNGALVKEIVMHPDTAQITTELNHKSLNWFVIIRDDKVGIRLRDYESETVQNFNGIERFPIDTTWRINAKFIKYDTPKKIIVPNIIGQSAEEDSPGEIVFTKDGNEYRISPIPSGNRYFIIFADETSGAETYGAGRFLYIDKEDNNGNIVMDFNKSYNPPCAFSKYATCPLPPKENHLHLAVTAGEKNWGHH